MKDFRDFIPEEDKKKPKKKSKKEKGADDSKFLALMGEYKQLRRSREDREKAEETLKEALKLAREGDVSQKAKVGAAYL